MVETPGPLLSHDTAATAHCPFCHAETQQVRTTAHDAAGHRLVDLVTCVQCGRDLL